MGGGRPFAAATAATTRTTSRDRNCIVRDTSRRLFGRLCNIDRAEQCRLVTVCTVDGTLFAHRSLDTDDDDDDDEMVSRQLSLLSQLDTDTVFHPALPKDIPNKTHSRKGWATESVSWSTWYVFNRLILTSACVDPFLNGSE